MQSLPWLLASILIVALLYWFYVPSPYQSLETLRHVNEKRRKRKNSIHWEEHFWEESHYVETPQGLTHYYLMGPEKGKKIVFVHGITAGSPCFPHFFELLVQKGYRVLTYDIFGRGFSDAPGLPYDNSLYVSQLFFLVHHLKWEKFHLCVHFVS